MTAAPLPSEPVVVVGAGLSGVACAGALHAAGLAVRVLDRGRRVGGRMASRRLDGRPVDLGASYLTVTDDRFEAVVRRWEDAGLAAPWTDTFLALAPGAEPEVKTGPVRWGAPRGLRSLVEDLAGRLPEVRSTAEVGEVAVGPGEESLLVDGEPASAVVLAMPDAQARRLLGPGLEAVGEQLQRASEPALAVAAGWAERTWDHLSPTGRFHGAFVADHDVLAWVADDGRRRGDDAPVLVGHSTPELAAQHLDDPQAAAPALVAALREVVATRAGRPELVHVHRWSLAKAAGEREAPYLLTGPDDGVPGLVGVCGDGWGPTSKVETAYLSGLALGEALADRLLG